MVFKSFYCFLKTIRKGTGLKSLRENCWEIYQVSPKCQIIFLGQKLQNRSKNEKKKKKNHHQILHIPISLDSKFQVKQMILTFWKKFAKNDTSCRKQKK